MGRFDGLKLDSCSQFNNMTLWAEEINATGHAVLLENCHRAPHTPRRSSPFPANRHRASDPCRHFAEPDMILGPPWLLDPALRPTSFHDLRNTTLTSGWAVAEGGLVPGQVMPGQDCKGDAGVSDCPYHVFRTSDDIYNTWIHVVNNANSVTPYLTQADASVPPRSRPGGCAYPDVSDSDVL